jgi:hypothetical protein
MKIENFKKYKKLYIVAFLFIIAIYLSPLLDLLISYLNNTFGVWSALILGYFYSFSFTSGASAVMLSNIKDNFLLFSFLSATGAMLADYTIFKLVKVNFEQEVKNLFKLIKLDEHFSNKWKPFVAFIIIGSPLPDEMGVLLLSHTKKLSKLHFLSICFLANFIFIYFITKFL